MKKLLEIMGLAQMRVKRPNFAAAARAFLECQESEDQVTGLKKRQEEQVTTTGFAATRAMRVMAKFKKNASMGGEDAAATKERKEKRDLRRVKERLATLSGLHFSDSDSGGGTDSSDAEDNH